VIYRVFTKSREYSLTGTPGLDVKAAFKRFLGKLSLDKVERRQQCEGVLKVLSPDEKPLDDDIETQTFVAVAQDSLQLRLRGVTEVNLMTDSVTALLK